jgi:hypothetical protein
MVRAQRVLARAAAEGLQPAAGEPQTAQAKASWDRIIAEINASFVQAEGQDPSHAKVHADSWSKAVATVNARFSD